jgi:hypothetical protein
MTAALVEKGMGLARAVEKGRHARACPGHPRLAVHADAKDVDGRDKPGHDGEVVIPGWSEGPDPESRDSQVRNCAP